MGRTVTPKYRVELEQDGFRVDPMCWNSRTDGRANAENLARFVEGFNASYRNGVNAHLAGLHHHAARLVRQADDVVVAEWREAGR